MPPPLKMQIFKVVLAISSVQLAVARDLGASFGGYADTLDQLNEDPWMGDIRGLIRASGGPSVGPTADSTTEPAGTEPSEGPFNPDPTTARPTTPSPVTVPSEGPWGPSGGPATTLPAVQLPDPIQVKEEHKAVHGPTKFVRLQYNAMSFTALSANKAVQEQLQQTTKETMIAANPAVSLFYTLDVNFHASDGRRLTSSGRRLTSSAGVIIETAMVQKNLTGTNVSAADLDSFSSGFSADIGGALTANIASSGMDVSALLKDGHAELGVPHVTVFVAEVGSDTATATSQIIPPTPTTSPVTATTPAPSAPATDAPGPATDAPGPATDAPAPATDAPAPAETTPAPETTPPSPAPTPPVVPAPGPTPATTDVDEDDSALSLRLLWAVGAMMAPYLMI